MKLGRSGPGRLAGTGSQWIGNDSSSVPVQFEHTLFII